MNIQAQIKFIDCLTRAHAVPVDWVKIMPLLNRGLSTYETLPPRLQRFIKGEMRYLTHTARGLVAYNKLTSDVIPFIQDIDSSGVLDQPEPPSAKLKWPGEVHYAEFHLKGSARDMRNKLDGADLFTESAFRFSVEQFILPALLDHYLVDSIYRAVAFRRDALITHREEIFSDTHEGRHRAVTKVRNVMQHGLQSRPVGEMQAPLNDGGYVFTLQAEDNVWLGLFHLLSVIDNQGDDCIILWNYDSTTPMLHVESQLSKLGHVPFDYRQPNQTVFNRTVRRLREDPPLSLIAVANGTDSGEALIKPVQHYAAEIARRSGRMTVPVYVQGANVPVNGEGFPAAPTQPRSIMGEPLDPKLSIKAIQKGTEEFIAAVGRPLLSEALAEVGLIDYLP